jgi:hypothetical protein
MIDRWRFVRCYAAGVRTVTRLATGEEFTIDDVRIRSDHSSWFPPELSRAHRLVLVRSGLYQLRVCDWEIMAHPMVAYVAQPGDEQRIAHRIGATDTCTSVTIAGPLLKEIVGEGSAALTRPMFTTGRVDLMHRMMIARARAQAEEFELLERVTRLADALLRPLVTTGGVLASPARPGRGAAPWPPPPGAPGPRPPGGPAGSRTPPASWSRATRSRSASPSWPAGWVCRRTISAGSSIGRPACR